MKKPLAGGGGCSENALCIPVVGAVTVPHCLIGLPASGRVGHTQVCG